MGKTNWKRVFLGGLVAGIVINILAFIATFSYLKELWFPALTALAHPVSNLIAFGIFWIAFYLITGILAIWLYSAIRPRYGEGAKTGVIAGLAVWVLNKVSFAAATSSLGMGLFPADVLVIDAFTHLVMFVVAALAGAWVYKEQE
jgi:hypothetical protein